MHEITLTKFDMWSDDFYFHEDWHLTVDHYTMHVQSVKERDTKNRTITCVIGPDHYIDWVRNYLYNGGFDKLTSNPTQTFQIHDYDMYVAPGVIEDLKRFGCEKCNGTGKVPSFTKMVACDACCITEK